MSERLADHTTTRVGGPARAWVTARTEAEAIEAVRAADAAGEPRVTLTLPALASAPEAFLMITGPDKRAALERVATLTPEEAPIRAFWKDLVVHWAE